MDMPNFTPLAGLIWGQNVSGNVEARHLNCKNFVVLVILCKLIKHDYISFMETS